MTRRDERETKRPPSAILNVVIITATTVLPYDHLERATAGLRGSLRLMSADHGADAPLDWTTLVVTGPTVTRDARGNTWFEWVGTVDV